MLRQQLLDTSRGRIVSLLQRGPLTADDLASRLEISASGVRAQIAAMERDGVVRQVGRRPGTTRPSRVFELTPEVEQLLSRAYIPLLTQLVDVFAHGLPGDQLDALLREAGRRLAGELSSGRSPGSLRSRVHAASEVLNEQLGAVTRVEENGRYVIRGDGCPLSALTGKHPAVCRAMESLVEQFVGASVHECCERAQRPRCCFEISNGVAIKASRPKSVTHVEGRRR
jgi:DeoR family transcriptional regulator, suf operon transcriptional repressor